MFLHGGGGCDPGELTACTQLIGQDVERGSSYTEVGFDVAQLLPALL